MLRSGIIICLLNHIGGSSNEPILCSATSKGKLPIQEKDLVWHQADDNGSAGYIDNSQVKL